MNETKTIMLKTPIEIDGKQSATVEMRRPLVGDLVRFSGMDEAERELRIIAHICGMDATVEEMYRWDAGSYLQLRGAYLDFLGILGV